jgi:5'-3' exonuclease
MTQIAAIELFTWLNCRQYHKSFMEADDLIYAFCRSNLGKSLIISSDGDFRQLCYAFKNVSLYDPMKNATYVPGDVDPLELKCFHGDKSDNISGYKGIGPKRAIQLINDINKQNEFLNHNGRDIYLLNRRLIDLSLCPYVADNILHIRSMITKESKFDKNKVVEMIKKHKIIGLMTEMRICERRFGAMKGW